MEDTETFSLFIYHGGYVEFFDGVDVYKKGYYVEFLGIPRSGFNFRRLKSAIKTIGYSSWGKLWVKHHGSYKFVEIKGEIEVMKMMDMLCESINVISVYVEGGVDDRSAGRLRENMTQDRVDLAGGNKDVEQPEIGVDSGGGDTGGDIGGVHGDGMVILLDSDEPPVQVDLGGIERADVDGIITQLEIDDQADVEVDDEFDFAYDGDEDDQADQNGGFIDEDFVDEELMNDEEYIKARDNAKETPDMELNRLMEDFEISYGEEDEPVSEYEDSDGDMYSDETDSDDEYIKAMRKKKVVYDPKCDHKSLKLQIGMRFQDGWQCKAALTTHSIENGKFVRFRRVSKTQCEARCSPSCPWKVYASVVRRDESFCIKTYGGDHHGCPRHTSNKLLTSKWIAMRYLNVYRVRNDFSASDLRSDIMARWEYEIPKDRLYKARTLAMELVRGTVDYHYGLVRRYLAELRRVDNDGRFELLLGNDHVFKGMYIGFSALIKGFKVSCRPLIGLDGTHLRTYLKGILLCAVAKDGNNQMFPIAWAVVEVENEECWSWFLKCLIEDVGIGDGNGYTFMSDQQKGLENAVKALSPYAEHRNCSRHIWVNWSKKHRGITLKNMFRNITQSTYPEEYIKNLEILRQESVDAYQDFISRDTHKFCKTFISTSCCSDMIDNNISETFNGYISNARGKHIIHMCEEIRSNLMMRQVKKLEIMTKVTDRICPNIRKRLEKLRSESAGCTPRAALFQKFEVWQYGNKFVVSMRDKTCSCREWQITGVPCVHAVASIHRIEEDPVNYVHPYYTVEKYLLAYQYGLPPVNGEQMWPEVAGFKVKPPIARKLPGRPKTKRIRSAGEVNPRNPKKLSLKGLQMTCKRCGQPDHNKRSCKNTPIQHPPVEKRNRGRPAKKLQPREGTSSNNVGSTSAISGRGSGGDVAVGRGGRESGGAAMGRGGAAGNGARRGGRSGVAREAFPFGGEMNVARSGTGVYIAQGTRNVYFHAPNQSVMRHVNRGNLHTGAVLTFGVNQNFNSSAPDTSSDAL